MKIALPPTPSTLTPYPQTPAAWATLLERLGLHVTCEQHRIVGLHFSPNAPTRMESSLLLEVATSLHEGTPIRGVSLAYTGTPFQHRVWQALQAIPKGQVSTYGELARDLGLPGGSRAVGSACGANPLALLIPCHRVIRSDGGLGGYRWGLPIKEQLLKAEGAL
jgi:O-6-methylguanine DNA methyltransferase